MLLAMELHIFEVYYFEIAKLECLYGCTFISGITEFSRPTCYYCVYFPCQIQYNKI